MAAIWKGSITFGLVSIPVELRSAVRTDNISFRMLHEEDLSPIKYERVCAADGEKVPWGEIVKGYEKAYALLREAIRNTGSIGIGKIIMRQTQHLAGVKVIGDAIVLEIMRFENELVDIGEFNFPSADGVRPQEIQMAEQLIANLAEPFDPSK